MVLSESRADHSYAHKTIHHMNEMTEDQIV
jgi:hypothetical protein